MTKIQFELDGKQVEAIDGETIWQVAKRQGREIPHLCYSPEPDYRPDGNCRACMVEIEGERVLAASCKRTPSVGMKVKSAERACGRGAENGDGTAGRRPAGARHLARSGVEILALGREGRGDRKPLSRGRALARRRQPSGHARQPRCLHPVQSVRARLPRGPGQRRDRHGLSQSRRQDRVRLRRSDGRIDLRGVRRMRAGLSDRRADAGGATSTTSRPASSIPTARSIRSARTAASAARSPTGQGREGSSTPRAATARPITTGSASRAASASTTSIIRIG